MHWTDSVFGLLCRLEHYLVGSRRAS